MLVIRVSKRGAVTRHCRLDATLRAALATVELPRWRLRRFRRMLATKYSAGARQHAMLAWPGTTAREDDDGQPMAVRVMVNLPSRLSRRVALGQQFDRDA